MNKLLLLTGEMTITSLYFLCSSLLKLRKYPLSLLTEPPQKIGAHLQYDRRAVRKGIELELFLEATDLVVCVL